LALSVRSPTRQSARDKAARRRASTLNRAIYARRGFNVIATANNRDKGVNELSSALKRRFNVVVVLPLPKNAQEEIGRVLTIFRELRSRATLDGKTTLKTPPGLLHRQGHRPHGRRAVASGVVQRRPPHTKLRSIGRC
jgi:hypothetical protein